MSVKVLWKASVTYPHIEIKKKETEETLGAKWGRKKGGPSGRHAAVSSVTCASPLILFRRKSAAGAALPGALLSD